MDVVAWISMICSSAWTVAGRQHQVAIIANMKDRFGYMFVVSPRSDLDQVVHGSLGEREIDSQDICMPCSSLMPISH